MKYNLLSFLLIVFFNLSAFCVYGQEDFSQIAQHIKCGKVEFSTIAKEFYSGLNKKENLVISNQKDWEKIWGKIYSIRFPQPKCPKVDFKKEIIIGLFAGEFYSGGYNIEATEVKKTMHSLEIKVKFVSPGPSCRVTSALSQPLHLIKIRKTKKKIVFEQTNQITNCNE